MEIELEFERKQKTKMIGVRLTEIEMQSVKGIAKRNGVSIAEACRQLIRAALKATNYNG